MTRSNNEMLATSPSPSPRYPGERAGVRGLRLTNLESVALPIRVLTPLSLAFSALAFSSVAPAAQFFATEVAAVTPGSSQQTGFTSTAVAFGGPCGTGSFRAGFDVYNLGVGGSITLGFGSVDGAPRVITNGQGADFTIFENAIAGDTADDVFAELAFVEVSSNGIDFARFPSTSLTTLPTGQASLPPEGTIDRRQVSGLAGVSPVFANVDTNTLDPFDPTVSGGDAFDLTALAGIAGAAIDLNAIRFVRLVDIPGDGQTTDTSGRSIYDAFGTGNGGFDLDAIAVINGAVVPEPTVALAALAALGVCRRHRKGPAT